MAETAEVSKDTKSAKKGEKGEKGDKATKNGAIVKLVEEKILPMAQVDADYEWNCRWQARTCSEGPRPETDGDPDAPGIEGIAGSLEMIGQETAVDVRPVLTGLRAKSNAVELVTGFRRYSAIKWLDEHGKAVLGMEPGHIRVRIHHEMTDAEARRMNVGENMVRENLLTPDLVYAAKRLLAVDPKLTAEDLTVMYAKSKGHMAAVVKVATKLREPTFKEWRETRGKALPIIEMATISDKPKAEQADEYAKALAAYSTEREKDPRAWVRAAIHKAEVIGTVIGAAQRKGVLAFNESLVYDDEDTELIRVFVRFRTKLDGKKVPQKTVARVAKAFGDAYIKAKNQAEDADDDDDEAENLD